MTAILSVSVVSVNSAQASVRCRRVPQEKSTLLTSLCGLVPSPVSSR